MADEQIVEATVVDDSEVARASDELLAAILRIADPVARFQAATHASERCNEVAGRIAAVREGSVLQLSDEKMSLGKIATRLGITKTRVQQLVVRAGDRREEERRRTTAERRKIARDEAAADRRGSGTDRRTGL